MTLQEVHALCVTGFPRSQSRTALMAGLRDIAIRLSQAGVAGELWVDGSFLTEKNDPEDVDLVLRIPHALYENGTTVQQDTIHWFEGNLKASHHCDTFCLVEYPEGHPQYWTGEAMYAYWMRQWSFSRGMEMKGIAVVSLPS